LRKSRTKNSSDLKYKIKSHKQRGGSKYISFVEIVKTEEKPRYDNIAKLYIEPDLNKSLELKKSGPKKSRDIKYAIESYTQRGGSKYISFVEKVKTEEKPRYDNIAKLYIEPDLNKNL